MEHIMYKSDNLIALQALMKDFYEKIDVMPIDPPYNTQISYIGYKDGQYENGWINFMRERLMLAYQLLSKQGIMFIHIDENELVELLRLCGEIFGSENIFTLVWKKTNELFDKNRKEKPLENGIRRTHEYILACFKDRKNTVLKPIMQTTCINGQWQEISKPLESVIDYLGTTSSAKDELESIFGDRNIFSTPKPVKLIKELIRSATNQQSVVLDFFAGSGTTGEAVLQLNKEDNGNRQFILVTNNENEIFDRVTLPRIQKVLSKYNKTDKLLIVE